MLAVRGGGHNVSGNGVWDRGLVLDLAQMNGVAVDPFDVQCTPKAGSPSGS